MTAPEINLDTKGLIRCSGCDNGITPGLPCPFCGEPVESLRERIERFLPDGAFPSPEWESLLDAVSSMEEARLPLSLAEREALTRLLSDDLRMGPQGADAPALRSILERLRRMA